MKPQYHRRHGRQKNRTLRYGLAGMAGAACVFFAVLLCSHLGTASANAAKLPSSVSQTEEASSSQAGLTVQPTPTASPAPTPEPELSASDWKLRLVNKDNPLPRDFTVELTQVDSGQFDARAADALSRMLEDMRAEGLSPMICSSFRTWEDQESLHQNKVDRLLAAGYSSEEAEVEANRWVVPAGTSEHELGLAVDIVASAYQILEEEQENTPEQQWLMAHCQEYGFILRYPKDKQEMTGVGYEPWHYRYVGVDAAQEIMSQGICLEEYLES